MSNGVVDAPTSGHSRAIEADETAKLECIAGLKETEQQSRDIWAPAGGRAPKTDDKEVHCDKLTSKFNVDRAIHRPITLVKTTLKTLNTIPAARDAEQDTSKEGFLLGGDGTLSRTEPKGSTSLHISYQIKRSNPARLHSQPFGKTPRHPDVVETLMGTSNTDPMSDSRICKTATSKSKERNLYIYLESTLYTLTKPAFRHGPIALPLAASQEKAQTTDETLDCTAFQTAIIGATGELDQHVEDDEEDTKQLYDVASWFDTLGFSSYGTLITEDVLGTEVEALASERLSCPRTPPSTSPTVERTLDLPIPVGAEFPSGFWNAPVPGQEFVKDKFFNSKGLKRWIGEGRPKRPSFYSTIESPPQSPMMPIVVSIDDGQGIVQDTVPMGYNLSHDLGDFLSWQADKLVYI
ncbi:unnamed protein product [Fusarium langsethiae]|nr:unnamed protein product [Fusarium langsethiae]